MSLVLLTLLSQMCVMDEGSLKACGIKTVNCRGPGISCSVIDNKWVFTADGGATGFGANPTDCAANQYATTIDSNGNLTCSQVGTNQLSGTVSVSQGGTGSAPGAGDQLLVSDSSSSATWRTLSDCQDVAGQHLNYTASTNTFSCGTSLGYQYSAALNFPNTAQNACSDLTITATDSRTDHTVALGVPNSALVTGASYVAWMSAEGVASVRMCCADAAGCDPGEATFRIRTFP